MHHTAKALPALSTARLAASCIETVRSQYSTPYFSRILKPSSSQAPGTAEDRDLLSRAIAELEAGPDHAAATMSTLVLETMDIITAILSTPGFWSTSLARPQFSC